jgi:glycosyltransferase involved in cell wall biosynthesis
VKILLVAYNCAPGAGSEDEIGWNVLRELSARQDVTVITRDIFREKIEQVNLPAAGHRIRFIYICNPVSRDSFSYKKFHQIFYYLWQLRAAKVVRRLTTDMAFDIVQHISWVRCWMPSAVLGAASGKIVWGPVGGIEVVPAQFLKNWGKGRLFEHIKHLVVFLSRGDPFLRKLAHKTALGVATTRESAAYMQRLGCSQIRSLVAVALSQPDVDFLSRLSPPDSSVIRFISIGRLLSWKGFQFGIEAFAAADIADSEYWIVGAGPAEQKLKALSERLGVQARVQFFGRLDHPQTMERLSACHVLVHPSFRDSGGFVCLEAMAARRPVICLNLGGPAVQVTPETGTIVEAESPQQVIRDIAAAMTRYAEDREFLCGQGERGLIRVLDFFTWEKKVDILSQWYAELLGE